MNRPNPAGEIRRLLVDPPCVAEALGLAEGAARQARGITVRCPWHNERTPSCSITVGADGTLRAHCFGCGHGGDVLHLVAQVRGLDLRRDFMRVLDEAAQVAGVKLDDYRPSKRTQERPISKPPRRRCCET
jgi:DNA primase